MQANFDLGFLGGGQLARMSIMAAQRMGLSCVSVDSSPQTPASQVAPAHSGPMSEAETLAPIFARCARVTLENEFIPARVIQKAMTLAGRGPDALIPGLETLTMIQDKLVQRQVLEKAGVPVPVAAPIEQDGIRAVGLVGFPMVLKARFGGYDGRGTRYARTSEELERHRVEWQGGGWLAEQFVDFKRELAVMVFVTPHGYGVFPTMETVQKDHVCDLVFPAEDVDASEIALKAVAAVGGMGLFGVELFETKDGNILVNELAPRPHNSGHYTLDWGGVTQFEQHVRAVMGLPAAPVDGLPTCMANLFGIEGAGDWRRGLVAALEADPGIRFHWYGKEEARPGRKMGHINATSLDPVARAVAARDRFYQAWKVSDVQDRD